MASVICIATEYSTMEVARTFLETSTIHGLGYISSSRKNTRLFWLVVVILGFTGAGLLIRESFQTWTDSPIKTTIETLPISEITLPKLTVCPPRNTYTDMNYDLMMTENGTLTDEMRNEMFKIALEELQKNYDYDRNSPLIESNKYYNWYHGYTEFHDISTMDYWGLTFKIYTSATSGVVATQNFGKPFIPDLVERKVNYRIFVDSPQSVRKNRNVTLHFKLEQISMSGGSIIDKITNSKLGILPNDMTTAKANSTPPDTKLSMSLHRIVSNDDLNTLKLDLMPGFRFSWWYTSTGMEVLPEQTYKDEEMNKNFKRYAKFNYHFLSSSLLH